jgi:5-methylcytosine-specific restriction endonuclease McrA
MIVPAGEVSPQTGRLVVLLCGPAGAGKTTAARHSGLTVYDRDDPQWTGERHFLAALRRLGRTPTARAVVIRAGASSSARAKAAALVQATHVYLLTAPPDELGRRIAHRGRADAQQGLASIRTWHAQHDQDDGVRAFPGWDALGPGTTPPPQRAPSSASSRYRRRGTTTQRGLGNGHQRLRTQLLPGALGTSCPGPWVGPRSPRCTGLMVDPKRMDLDDRVPRALGGRSTRDGARICCSACNRGAGARLGNAMRRRSVTPVQSRRW